MAANGQYFVSDLITDAHNLCYLDICLCQISQLFVQYYHKHLELLFWRARPDSPTYLQGCTIFFLHLNNVYNKIKISCCHLKLNPLATRWHTVDSTSPYSVKPFLGNTERKMLDFQALASKAAHPTV